MMTAFNFDFTNTTHTQAFAQMCAIATQAGVPMQVMGAYMNTGACVSDMGTQAQASTPTPTPKVYAPAEDVACQWLVEGTKVSYTLTDGKYVGQTGVRKTLNARLRNAGATWDASAKVWKFASKAKAEKFAHEDSYAHIPGDTPEAKAQWVSDNFETRPDMLYTLVTAQEIEGVRAKAQARAEKKANKGA